MCERGRARYKVATSREAPGRGRIQACMEGVVEPGRGALSAGRQDRRESFLSSAAGFCGAVRSTERDEGV